MNVDVVWQHVRVLFEENLPDASEKLTEVLIKSKESLIPILSKTLQYLNENGNENFYVCGTCAFMRSILHLTQHPPAELNDDEICEMVTFIMVELRHFGTPTLVQTASYCLNEMNTTTTSFPLRWVEVFGKVVTILSGRGDIENDDGDILEGQEYKEEIISDICRISWGPLNAASLIAALREMAPIDSQSLRLILDKTELLIGELEPTFVPPITYQLLLLASSTFPAAVVAYFNDYFTDVDVEFIKDNDGTANGARMLEKRKILGITVYHFVQRARNCEQLLKELLKRIKASQHYPPLLIYPFMASTALGIACIDRVKKTVIDTIKTAMLKCFKDIHWRNNCVWYSQCGGKLLDETVKSCFTTVLDTTNDFDFLLDGIKALGVGLIDCGDPVLRTEKLCNMTGDYLLVSLVSKKPYYLPNLIQEFLNNPELPPTPLKAECLARCLRQVIYPRIPREYVEVVRELIHQLPLMSLETAVPIIKAMLPSIQLSAYLFGELMMIIKRTVWKSKEPRRVLITLTMLLLCNSQIFGQIPRSQFSNTQFFKISQFSNTQMNILGSSTRNESICYELLGTFKKMFKHEFSVRKNLYVEMLNVARQNPALISVLCTGVDRQVKEYFELQSEGRYEINKTKMNQFASYFETQEESDPLVEDPIGYLVQCLSFLVIKSRHVYGDDQGGFSEDTPASVLACAENMDVWITDIGNVLTNHFMKKLNPTQLLTYDFGKNRFVKQLLQILEALIEYLCLGGKTTNDRALLQLFEKFTTLQTIQQASKVSKRTRRKRKATGTVKAKQDTTVSMSSDSTSTPAEKFSSNEKPDQIIFTHIITIESLVEIFIKFYAEEDFGMDFDPIGLLKNNKAFEKFLLSIFEQKVDTLNRGKVLKERDKESATVDGHLARIAGILWTQTGNIQLDTTSETMENELGASGLIPETTLELTEKRLELVHLTVKGLFCRGTDRQFVLSRFLTEPQQLTYGDLFAIFFEQFTKNLDQGPKYKLGNGLEGIFYNLFLILKFFVTELTIDEEEILNTVLTWFTKFLGEKSSIFVDAPESHSCIPEVILETFAVVVAKARTIPDEFFGLANKAHFIISDVDGETTVDERSAVEKFWLISDTDTATAVMYQFVSFAETTLKMLKNIVGRFSCTYVVEVQISTWRDICCTKMLFLVQLLTSFLRSKFPVGPWVEILYHATWSFFIIMHSITESFVTYHTKHKRFKSKPFQVLVKAIGSDFKIRAEAMVHHLEKIMRQEWTLTAKKKLEGSTKNSITKDTKRYPALMYAIEKYEHLVIVLTEKTKINLLHGTRLSAPRDFRIITSKQTRPCCTKPPGVEPASVSKESPTTSTLTKEDFRVENEAGPSSGRKRPRL